MEILTIPHSKSKYILTLTTTFHWLFLKAKCDRCLGCNCQSAFTWQLKTQYITLISFALNTSTIKKPEQGIRNWHHFQKLSLHNPLNTTVYILLIFLFLCFRDTLLKTWTKITYTHILYIYIWRNIWSTYFITKYKIQI